MIILFQFDYILSEEQKCGRWSDVGRIFTMELHILIVEGQPHFHGEASHDVLDEMLDDFQVGLKGLDLGSKILGDFLDRFVEGEEEKNLIDVSAKDVNTTKLLD